MDAHLICPICASPEQVPLSRSQTDPAVAALVRCKSCHFIYRRPTGVSYRPTQEPVWDDAGTAPVRTVPKEVTEHRLHLLENAVLRGSLLDIGCGNGEFLQQARYHGWVVAGIEPSEAADRAQDLLRDVAIPRGLQSGLWPAGSFDAVTIWHKLDQSQHPAELLSLAAHYCRVDGVLALAVLNGDTVIGRFSQSQADYTDTPAQLFSATALDWYLGRFGFRVERIERGPGSWRHGAYIPGVRGLRRHENPVSPFSRRTTCERRPFSALYDDTLTVIARYVP